ncbi:protein-disulfide reductase DsbD domain-containing protein [uncultured Litoreibacter sp.]|uniref:protein-disulfide reductase DsbD domain-containing protein n=1 Tax=uncultured Litoreibacter sp. TaxID=1392394 RepID=UPI0026392CC2|nr:protein-disulfide reductase DsbD domain-containing protein [uncultured Litoreibacter sp.]
MNRFLTSFGAALVGTMSALSPASAQIVENGLSDVVSVSLLTGWRDEHGTHHAALRFSLAPGWKTYWRAPGDGGIPTRMDWSASTNLREAHTLWPIPQVFRQNGLRSVGYRDEFVLPLAFDADGNGPIEIDGHLAFGVCDEVCMPVNLDLHALLDPADQTDVTEISAALQRHPLSADQANVQNINCALHRSDTHTRIDVELDMPPLAGNGEAVVIEVANPHLWVAEPLIHRDGDHLKMRAEVASRTGAPFAVDMQQMRVTVITTQTAVEIIGCP